MKTKPPGPVSLRINAETRAVLDYLIERTGLKDAQIIRLAIKQMEERERALAAAAPKPARKIR
jgi:predicted DNA-binding protein